MASRNASLPSKPKCTVCIGVRIVPIRKRMFGDAFHYVPYVECAIPGQKDMAAECKVAGVKLFPSWQFGMDPPHEGVLSLQTLSDKTGCALP